MTQEQINRKEMHDATLGYLDLHSEKWIPVGKVSEFKNELNDINQKIEEEAKKQMDAQIFVGKNKSELKMNLAKKADILNDAVEVHATATGNTELAQQMSDSASDILRLRNEEFVLRVKLIEEKTTLHINILKRDYGIPEELLTDYRSNIDRFLEMNGMPRAYRVASSVATQDIKELFTRANDILVTKLDKVMKIFKNRDANFYKGYLAARSVINN